jgi:hypothetical protein
MTNRSDIFSLLRARAGTWVGRDDINFIGGADAGRRLRELNEDVAKSGEWRLESQRDAQNRYEYRLMPIIPDAPRVKGIYRCVKCGSRPNSVTMASIDERWRIGQCPVCGKNATFQKSPA